MPRTVSVVVPVYNNQETLEETTRQILAVHEGRFGDLRLEMVFVNDGSTDGSWNELLRLKSLHDDKITLLNLSRNFGQQGALFAGFSQMRGDAVICVSADLQDPIELIGNMVESWRSGIEVVICYRQARSDGFASQAFSAFAYFVLRASNPEIPKGGFDYWLMSRRACKLVCSLKGRDHSLQGDVLGVGFSRAFIPYTRLPRRVGRSGYTFWKKLTIVLDFLVTASYLPIRCLSVVGAVMAFGGAVYSLLIVYAWYTQRTPFEGWAPLMILQMVMGGVIMLMLGAIAEYVWRVYDSLKDFPAFIIEQRLATEHEFPELTTQPTDRL
jgi:glycosyltransferase involved in cell wall biosynthesis